MRYIQTNATGVIPIGPFVSSVDGVTPISNLVASSLNGVLIVGGTTTAYYPNIFTYDTGGQYYASTPTGLTTLGPARINFSNPSLFAPVWDDLSVLSPDVYASLFGTSSLIPIPPTDPWLTSLPGSYTGSQAGNVLGNQASLPIQGTVHAGATTTSFTLSITSGNSPVTSQSINNRGCLFKSGALLGAYPDILSSIVQSANVVTITVSALPAVPALNDVVQII